MKDSSKIISNDLKNILDSDDELPTEYVDLPRVPAYLNEKRFDNTQKHHRTKAPRNEQTKDPISSKIISDGYLNKKDMFCLQCLEPAIGEEVLIWFLNFLKTKDLQSNLTFLSTCLVPSYVSGLTSKAVVDCDEGSLRYRLITSKRL